MTLKFKDEDAEAVMAKALEGGSDSEKAGQGQAFPEPMEIPAALEILVDAMKRDGSERKPSGEETPSKKQKVLIPQMRKHFEEGEGVSLYIIASRTA